MSIAKMCPPALLYLAFSLTHIIIDTFRGSYSTAFTKFIVMIIFTLVLNIMCESGLSVISWVIVFLPFILMTYITAVLMYVFGLQPSSSDIPSSSPPKEKQQVDPHTKFDNHRNSNPSCVDDTKESDSDSTKSDN